MLGFKMEVQELEEALAEVDLVISYIESSLGLRLKFSNISLS